MTPNVTADARDSVLDDLLAAQRRVLAVAAGATHAFTLLLGSS